jgi:ABC-type multidrug transport system fused ATPase/permease subunit
MRPYWHLAAATVVLIFVTGLVDLLGPWPMQVLVDNVLGDEPPPAWLAWFFDEAQGSTNLLLLVVCAGLIIALVDNALNVVSEYVHTSLDMRMSLDFRSDLFQHAQRLSLAFHDRKRSGMLIYVINSQADAAADLIMTVPGLAQSLVTLVGMFAILYCVNPMLALLSTVVVPFLCYSIRYYVTRIQDRLLAVRELEGESLSIIHEALSMLRVIVAFGREPYEHARFCRQGRQAVTARVAISVRQTLFSLAINMTTATGTTVVLGYGAYLVLQGELSVGVLLVVMSYIAMVYHPLEHISFTIGSLQEKFVGLRMAFKLLDTQPDVKESSTARHVERAAGRVTFEHVDFAYQGRKGTLQDISFDVAPGQTVAIVGPTGAGKTTLISLLPRFYDAQRGRILLDGAEIRELTLRSLRDQLSLVLQEPLLFSTTVAQNIRYGRLDAKDDEVVQAAIAANAHEFIMRLPKGYDTELGERGLQLSGGERQRICVARAFLKDAPILILDEPTSSIDSKTEAVILDALDRLIVGRTTFLIAHRLSTIRRADYILVLEHGRLVQAGTHESLVAEEGLYKQLWEMQTQRPRRGGKSVFTPAPDEPQ